MTDAEYDKWYESVTVKELRRHEIADEMGLFGESAMTQRFKFLAYIMMAINGNEDAQKYATRIIKDLDR